MNTDGNSATPASASSSSGEKATEDRIKELQTALTVTQRNVQTYLDESAQSLCWIIVICGSLLIAIGFFIHYLLDLQLPDVWTWQIAYYTTIRVTAISGLFALLTYCFKLLKSFIQIYYKGRHRLTVVSSMASLVESATFEERNNIYNKLLDIVVDLGETGLLEKDVDYKLPNELIIGLLKDKIQKK